MEKMEQELRQILELQETDKGHCNYSVVAGAGAGKTTMLSKRISQQILNGEPIDKFVIITYTNAAAAELREKITGNLQQLLDNGITKTQERENVEKALHSIELMQISTIHAFLLKLLRENAFEAHVTLDCCLLTSDEERKKEFFDRWYQVHYDEIEQKFGADWTETNSNGYTFNQTRTILWNLFKELANVREEVVIEKQGFNEVITKSAQEYVDEWYDKLENFVETLVNNAPAKKDGDKKYSKYSQDIMEAFSIVDAGYSVGQFGEEEACSLSDALETIKEVIHSWDLKSKKYFYGKNYFDLEIDVLAPENPTANVPDYCWNFKKIYNSYMLSAEKASQIAEYVADDMCSEYQKMIDANTSELSNDEILYRAEQLLCKNPYVLNRLRERYSKIYVDEFQDTTGLQSRIIELLTSPVESDLDSLQLQPDKLIVVGDPKQSIYRFTGAEKAVFDQFHNKMSSVQGSEAVELKENFRSNWDIVEWVNASFGKLMGKEYTPMTADWKMKEQESLHGVYFYGLDNANDYYSDAEDVDAVVSLVKELTGADCFFLEERMGKEDCILRQIRYSDFMIITRNTTRMSEYAQAFAEKGIPVNVQGKIKIQEDEILKNYLILLEYFAEPKNKSHRIAAAQVLGGFDVAGQDTSVLKYFQEKLYQMKQSFSEGKYEPAAIAQEILRNEDWYLPKEETIPVERVREYKIRIYQMVENCTSVGNGDLKALVDRMKVYLNSEIKREIPLDSNENAVRLMNVHQSKGLTGRIVIIADRGNNEQPRFSGYRSGGKYYPAVSKQGGFGQYKVIPTFGHDWKKLKQVAKEEEEEAVRLQYVAATRASHALIIMPKTSCRKENIWFSNEAYHLQRQTEINQWMNNRKSAADRKDILKNKDSLGGSITLLDLKNNLEQVDVDALGKEQLSSITPSGLESKGVTGYSPNDKGYRKENRPMANVFGTVMHRTFELIVIRYQSIIKQTGGELKKALTRVINQAIMESMEDMREVDDPKQFLEYLLPVMEAYLPEVITPIMESAEAVYPEFEFSFYVPESEIVQFRNCFDSYLQESNQPIPMISDKIWVNGQADLVVKQTDGTLKVYDYKSDAQNGKPDDEFEKALAEKYEGQLALYRYAVSKAFDVEEKSVKTELISLYR